jgi:hypothetical protein
MVGEVDSTKVVNTFIAGLITEAGPLTFPENASIDELNCLLFRKGNRRRRLGIDYENDHALSTSTVTDTLAASNSITTGVWTSVAGSGVRNFLVVQIDTTLHFYDLSYTPLSDGLKSFTQDISSFAATGATDTGSEPLDFESGRGLLFCSSKKLEPFYIEYNDTLDTITAAQISLEIRDFDGVVESPALDNDEEPSSLNITHEYNLKNQGWNSTGGASPIDHIAVYAASQTNYPNNAQQWFTGKNSSDVFDPALLIKFSTGNTLAPRGHFLLNPFYKDRSTVSSVSGLTIESEDNRPEVIKFYAGRMWYMGVDSSAINGHVFFSQVVITPEHAGRCYQQSDPTGEELSELLDNDGGVVVIPELGQVRGAVVKDRFLIIFASNGVWAISGASQDGFKATDFQVQKITNVGCIGKDTVVETESFPIWWSDQGIYTIGANEGGELQGQSLSLQTIETFYQDEIPTASKKYARGIYDPASKRVMWLYNTTGPTDTTDRWKYNACLLLDTSLGAFYPWKIKDLTNESPYLVGVFNTQAALTISDESDVIDSSGNELQDSSFNDVIVNTEAFPNNISFLKFMAIVPNKSDTTNTWVFCDFNNDSFLDWETSNGIGISYDSYAELGYEMFGTLTKKQTPYIQFFFNKTETGSANGELLRPSSCFMQTKWDWTSSGDAGRWSEKQQIYKLKREFDNGQITTSLPGEDVVVSETKVRGHGKVFQVRFESEAGHDFDLAGWQTFLDQHTNV